MDQPKKRHVLGNPALGKKLQWGGGGAQCKEEFYLLWEITLHFPNMG